MKNSSLNNEDIDYEIYLRELLRIILNSKKLIILITLTSALLAFAYLAQKEAEYQSTVILEVGSYDLPDGEKKLVMPVSSLIKKLKINQISKNLNTLNLSSLEDQFLEIKYLSPSSEFNEKLINGAIRFIEESHTETIVEMVNSFSEKIMAIDNKIEFRENSIKSQQESQKLIAINSIKAIDNEMEFLKSKIKYLLRLIPEEENNLLLLESNPPALMQRVSSSPTLQQIIYSYNEKVINLENQIKQLRLEKEALELQVQSIEEGEIPSEEFFYASEELFKLNQEKEALVLQVKLVKDQTNMTQPIRKLETNKIKNNTLIIILFGTILGFIFSIFIVLIRQAFLKEQN